MNSVMAQLQQYKEDLEAKGHQVYALMLKGSQNYNLHDSESDVDANAILIPSLSASEYACARHLLLSKGAQSLSLLTQNI